MATETITLQIPDTLNRRLEHTAHAMGRSLDDVLQRRLQVGSPPTWDDVPPEYRSDLAALDDLDDAALWALARSQKTDAEMSRYDALLDQAKTAALSIQEQRELETLRADSERFMLRKAHAAVLLRWRGHTMPPP